MCTYFGFQRSNRHTLRAKVVCGGICPVLALRIGLAPPLAFLPRRGLPVRCVIPMLRHGEEERIVDNSLLAILSSKSRRANAGSILASRTILAIHTIAQILFSAIFSTESRRASTASIFANRTILAAHAIAQTWCLAKRSTVSVVALALATNASAAVQAIGHVFANIILAELTDVPPIALALAIDAASPILACNVPARVFRAAMDDSALGANKAAV